MFRVRKLNYKQGNNKLKRLLDTCDAAPLPALMTSCSQWNLMNHPLPSSRHTEFNSHKEWTPAPSLGKKPGAATQ